MIDPAILRRSENLAPSPNWGRPPVLTSPDLTRVLALPRRPVPDEVRQEALIDLMTERLAKPAAPCRCAELGGKGCITRLRAVQAWALYEIGLRGGLLGPINVGDGKTILDILAPLALARHGARTVLLLVPAKLVSQLVTEYLRVREHFRVPQLVVHGDGTSVRSDEPTVLHVISYERLSRADATEFLTALKPDAIVADEVHHLRNATAVRTGRVLRYFAANPRTRFCGWSGSITDASIMDMTPASALALREGSPLPLDLRVAEDWSGAIDPSDTPARPGALARFCTTAEPSVDELRAAFHSRLVETPGVVTSSAPSVDVELTVEERQAPPIPHSVAVALTYLRETWTRPDDELILDALAWFRCARELACGFYYRWKFTHGETTAEIDEWKEARKAWRREVRDMLYRPQPQLDSPHLLALAAARAHANPQGRKSLWWVDGPNGERLPCWLADEWPRWRAARPLVNGGRVPDTEPVRLDPYLAEDSAAWARDHRGIVWCDKRAFAVWVAELGQLPYYGGGPNAGAEVEALVKSGRRDSIVASIKSHGEGRDGFQYLFHEQLVAHPPSGSAAWEQLLGRLHRSGQKVDVESWYYAHTPELQQNVDTALNRAGYVQGYIGARQKLLTGVG